MQSNDCFVDDDHRNGNVSRSFLTQHNDDRDGFVDNTLHGAGNESLTANVNETHNPIVTLDHHIKILYALNGLIEVVPNLALLSLVNDRVKLPTEYIPPYYAIEFLPYSLKPLYALSTYWITSASATDIESNSHSTSSYPPDRVSQEENMTNIAIEDETAADKSSKRIRCIKIQRHWLLASLQICASLSIGLTAFLPPNAIVPCFIMGFLRGFTISWSEFLNGLALISFVRHPTLLPSSLDCHDNNDSDNNDSDNNDSDTGVLNNYARIKRRNDEEMLLSSFQSNAATYRNIGSSIGEIIVLSIIFGRKFFPLMKESNSDGDDDSGVSSAGGGALTDSFVTMMLLGSAIIPLIASFVALKGKVGTTNHHHYLSSNRRHGYRGLYSEQNNCSTQSTRNSVNNIQCQTGYNPVSLENEDTHSSNDTLGTLSYKLNKSHILHVKRVGLYLILRHAVPSSSGLIASYEYTVFRTRPLYLQLKSFLMSITAVLSTWTYGCFISKNYTSIKGISRAIIVATVVMSMWSMIFLPFYENFRNSSDRMTETPTAMSATTAGTRAGINDSIKSAITSQASINGDQTSFDGPLWLLVLFVVFQLFGSFLSEISFLPSVVLATNTVAHLDDKTVVLHGRASENGNDDGNNDNDNDNDDDGDENDELNERHNSNNNQNVDNIFDQETSRTIKTTKPWYLNDDILYGIMISCIDFGDQLGAWITTPLIRVLNIQRENNWDNLDWFVTICAVSSIASLGFLRILWHGSKPVDR